MLLFAYAYIHFDNYQGKTDEKNNVLKLEITSINEAFDQLITRSYNRGFQCFGRDTQ